MCVLVLQSLEGENGEVFLKQWNDHRHPRSQCAFVWFSVQILSKGKSKSGEFSPGMLHLSDVGFPAKRSCWISLLKFLKLTSGNSSSLKYPKHVTMKIFLILKVIYWIPDVYFLSEISIQVKSIKRTLLSFYQTHNSSEGRVKRNFGLNH